jgi:DNA replication protein DnaC
MTQLIGAQNSLLCGNAVAYWTEIFHNDAAVTSAILDRLLHHSEVVIIEGKSYRMKDRSSLN